MESIYNQLANYDANTDDARSYFLNAVKDNIVRNHAEFREVIRFANDNVFSEEDLRELATRCEVADSTVQRWAGGIARPHPNLWEIVRADIVDILMQR